MSENPNPKVIRPIPDHCQMHGRTLTVPVKPEGERSHYWICIVCVTEGFWNDDITEKVQKNWPEQLKLGPLALKEHLRKEKDSDVKRKGATGV